MTIQLLDTWTLGITPRTAIEYNGKVYFTQISGSGLEVRNASDGTHVVSRTGYASDSRGISAFGDNLYFSATSTATVFSTQTLTQTGTFGTFSYAWDNCVHNNELFIAGYGNVYRYSLPGLTLLNTYTAAMAAGVCGDPNDTRYVYTAGLSVGVARINLTTGTVENLNCPNASWAMYPVASPTHLFVVNYSGDSVSVWSFASQQWVANITHANLSSPAKIVYAGDIFVICASSKYLFRISTSTLQVVDSVYCGGETGYWGLATSQDLTKVYVPAANVCRVYATGYTPPAEVSNGFFSMF